jgi:triacylglycerol lipase
MWGPFDAQSGTPYEFVITAPDYVTTHIYRSPFPRASSIVHLRAERIADADKDAITNKGSIITLSRPRGYFDLQHDTISLDGQSRAPGLPASGAGLAASKIKLKDVPQRPIRGSFNGETITGQAWPAEQNHLSTLEITN